MHRKTLLVLLTSCCHMKYVFLAWGDDEKTNDDVVYRSKVRAQEKKRKMRFGDCFPSFLLLLSLYANSIPSFCVLLCSLQHRNNNQSRLLKKEIKIYKKRRLLFAESPNPIVLRTACSRRENNKQKKQTASGWTMRPQRLNGNRAAKKTGIQEARDAKGGEMDKGSRD